jgi:hypothetical protein
VGTRPQLGLDSAGSRWADIPFMDYKLFAGNNSNKSRAEKFYVSNIVPCQVKIDFASLAVSAPDRVSP